MAPRDRTTRFRPPARQARTRWGRPCIREGRADVVLTVGADASITPLVFAGFCSLRALSTKYNDEPERASRPFDRGRDGFVMGEGAGALLLESAAHARKRKARVY